MRSPELPTAAMEALSAFHSSAEQGLKEQEARARLLGEGGNEVPEAPRHPVRRLLEKFWGLSAWMLELIAVLSFLLHKAADFWIALALLGVNAVLSFLQEERASSAVAALRRRLEVSARVLRDGRWRSVPARELVTGDVVRVRTGDFVPADLLLLDGELGIDQSALTGESEELAPRPDQPLYAGSIVRRGEATAVVTATGARTYFGRTTHLVEGAQPKLHVEEVTARFVRWLFVIVGILVGIAVVASLARGLPILEILPLSLVLLMSAVPVALPVMFTVSTAVGSMELGRQGVLVTHLAAVEDAATMDVLCADKTGTLTMNRLSVVGALALPGFTEEDVVRTAAMASNPANQDPIDVAFLDEAGRRRLLDPAARALGFVPFSPRTRVTEGTVELGGRRIHAVKGALRAVAAQVGLGPDEVRRLENKADQEVSGGAARVLAVARAEEQAPLALLGLAFLHDPPRSDSRQLVERLRSMGIATKMLTGDGVSVAREIARELGLGEIRRASELRDAGERTEEAARIATVADGFAEVFPEDKFLVVKSLQSSGRVVGMTGDGVNDAPALRQAEVGIAVSGATDVARSAASVVLTTEGLSSIVDLVGIGRSIYQRVLTWIVNKVSRTILKAGFVVVAFLVTGQFVISALGMVLLVFMTDFVKIALSVDRVHPSPSPETWEIGPLVEVAVGLGLMMLAEALLLLGVGSRLFHLQGLGLHTFSFLTLLFLALFSIVSVRERRAFWRSRPAWPLALALAADGLVGLLIGLKGLAELPPLPEAPVAFVAGWALFCCLGPNDVLKAVLTDHLWTSRPRAG